MEQESRLRKRNLSLVVIANMAMIWKMDMCGVTSIIIINRMITIVLTERRGDCMGDYMTLDRLVAMVDAFIRCDSLCEGCEIDDDHGMPCRECREQAADRIEEILMDNERQINRAELFNKLAEIKAPPEANEYKVQVYALIQSM